MFILSFVRAWGGDILKKKEYLDALINIRKLQNYCWCLLSNDAFIVQKWFPVHRYLSDVVRYSVRKRGVELIWNVPWASDDSTTTI